MAVADGRAGSSDGKLWGLCRLPFWQAGTSGAGGGGGTSSTNSSSSLTHHQHHHGSGQLGGVLGPRAQQSSGANSVSSVARSILPTRRRLRLDPPNKLYFPYEPGKQVRSAIRIKNTSKSYVAFKFQTTAPKSCFMRPPGAILSPGESIIATVFKFVEHPENNEKPLLDQKNKVKFKIMSLKVKGPMEYVPELFDEHKDQVSIEQILKVVFLDSERPSTQLEKLKRQLAEAEAALEARKKPAEDSGPRIVGEGLVIDEWKERRERYLARQQVEGAVDSV
ncbi:vesicle-associated protein 4-2-like [Dendrobium catenatum]|uniref:Vesicle-associated protein 4-2 n=1 Tax=Dendrobium catenatum TaxID=906689 RepID=A0A2I0X9K3_9ASPA|nr:vesicle-associated protein 4-2-like [Dendrobium catenatum]PKU84599.1 Vesicle-associated protein 4-2 [Dendrobium catenatum]